APLPTVTVPGGRFGSTRGRPAIRSSLASFSTIGPYLTLRGRFVRGKMIMHDDPNPISRGRGLRLVPSLLVVLLVASVFVVSNGSNALSIGRSPGAHPASPAPTA